VRLRLDAVEQEKGRSRRLAEAAGFPPPPGARLRTGDGPPLDSALDAPPTAAYPSACASRRSRDQSGAGTAPGTDAPRPRIVHDERLLLRPPERLQLGIRRAVQADGEPSVRDARLSRRRRTSSVAEAALLEPEAELLSEVERER
jgi:hypothetical protein